MDDNAAAAPIEDDTRFGRILHHAAWQFVTHGFDKANVQEIALASGVGKPTIYEMFGSKLDLLRAVLERSLKQLRVPIDSHTRGDTTEARLIDFSTRFLILNFERLEGRPSLVALCRLAVSSAVLFPDISADFFKAFQKNSIRIIREVLEREGFGQGEACDIRALTQAFGELVLGNSEVFYGISGDPTPEQIEVFVAQRVRLFLYGAARHLPG